MSHHNLLVYRGAGEFLARVGGFVREGLAEGERVLVIADEAKLSGLRDEVGSGAGHLDLWDCASTYRDHGRVFQLTVDYLHEQAGRTRLVAEPDLAARSRVEVEAYMCREAAANAVYGDLPVTVLCAYDAADLPTHVIDSCRQTHGGLLTEDRLVRNPGYVEPADFLSAHCVPGPPPPSAEGFTCESVDDLARARRLVAGAAARAGLDDQRREELVIAANEVLTNALTHGRPPARLHLYREGPAVVCHVTDAGPGFDDPLVGYVAPPDDLTSGRGLVLARQLCDSVEIATDGTGTHVRLLVLTGR